MLAFLSGIKSGFNSSYSKMLLLKFCHLELLQGNNDGQAGYSIVVRVFLKSKFLATGQVSILIR
jgi:hypothetical protein